MSSGSKSKSKSISLEPDLWERVEAKAAKKFGGNRSLYARELFKRDLDGESTGTNELRGAEAFAKFRAALPGNYADRLLLAAAARRPFSEIVIPLTDGNPALMALARESYDFLVGNHPALTALREIRDLLKAGANLPESAAFSGVNEPAQDAHAVVSIKTGPQKKAEAAVTPRQTKPVPRIGGFDLGEDEEAATRGADAIPNSPVHEVIQQVQRHTEAPAAKPAASASRPQMPTRPRSSSSV